MSLSPSYLNYWYESIVSSRANFQLVSTGNPDCGVSNVTLLYKVSPDINRLNIQAALFADAYLRNRNVKDLQHIFGRDKTKYKLFVRNAYIYSYAKSIFLGLNNNLVLSDGNRRNVPVLYGHGMMWQILRQYESTVWKDGKGCVTLRLDMSEIECESVKTLLIENYRFLIPYIKPGSSNNDRYFSSVTYDKFLNNCVRNDQDRLARVVDICIPTEFNTSLNDGNLPFGNSFIINTNENNNDNEMTYVCVSGSNANIQDMSFSLGRACFFELSSVSVGNVSNYYTTFNDMVVDNIDYLLRFDVQAVALINVNDNMSFSDPMAKHVFRADMNISFKEYIDYFEPYRSLISSDPEIDKLLGYSSNENDAPEDGKSRKGKRGKDPKP